MYETQKKNMKAISQYAGRRLDFVQGGGGNTSYKFDDKVMAIKASGCSLSEVEEDSGYITVDYAAIREKYADLAKTADEDVEAKTLAINLQSVRLLPGMENKRPSVEVGFHSYLKRAVIHTHSVYANLLCCSEEGEQIAREIFGRSDLGFVFLPFINPGFTLSMAVREKTEEYHASNGKHADLVFLKNHGMIASSDDVEEAIAKHDMANEMIISRFGCKPFPQCRIAVSGGVIVSDTPFLKDFIQRFAADEKYFDTTILYPDQIVYLGTNLGVAIQIDSKTGDISYKTSERQAQTIEEVLLGISYIITEIERLRLKLQPLCSEGINFIRNWESEKYRASLIKPTTASSQKQR